ncbi:hypothetical protein SAMN05421805_1011512 [Saccharopolyspora antimicrobica]|uniref:Uncharacterized protein n=1 Tax=Saccharopolyspora antimicrobica TaxID=455193 RepID=A0A1I4TPG2_9PSEU|nr:hypothetical protein [Saccharopolyspora antimicrobica]RKT88491.1 hypothetical protein ATL45_6926 [Saccharopolyspora antimicrobica]SFM78473.1 hypothetical protein SAMN05421805_1011512 [Saccharopolyspora antimicrobica]
MLRGDLAGALAEARAAEVAAEATRQLPVIESGLPVNDPDAMQKHPGMLRRLLAALGGLAS